MPDYPTFHGVLDTIGATPLIRLDRIHDRPETDVWAKLEGVNPGGSAKDRTAAALFADATENGRLIDVDSIIESTSGNLGIALARQALLAGLKFHCVADPNINHLTKKTMQALGATIHVVNEPDRATGDWLTARKAMVDRLLKEIPRSATFDQYANRAAFSDPTREWRAASRLTTNDPDDTLLTIRASTPLVRPSTGHSCAALAICASSFS